MNEFLLKIMDDDMGSDDLMASVRVVIDSKTKDKTVNLKKGTVHFSYKVLTLAEVAGAVGQLPKGGMPPSQGNLNCAFDRLLVASVFSAKGLRNKDVVSKSDPYAVLSFDAKVTGGEQGGGRMARTATVKDNLDPTWNTMFGFLLSPGAGRCTFSVYDEDFVSSDVIGTAQVLIRDPFAGQDVGLNPQGSINVGLAFAPLSWLFTFEPDPSRARALSSDRLGSSLV